MTHIRHKFLAIVYSKFGCFYPYSNTNYSSMCLLGADPKNFLRDNLRTIQGFNKNKIFSDTLRTYKEAPNVGTFA